MAGRLVAGESGVSYRGTEDQRASEGREASRAPVAAIWRQKFSLGGASVKGGSNLIGIKPGTLLDQSVFFVFLAIATLPP